MTNAEARCNKSLRPRKPEGSLGRTAQDVHLDSHTAPELWAGPSTPSPKYMLVHAPLQTTMWFPSQWRQNVFPLSSASKPVAFPNCLLLSLCFGLGFVDFCLTLNSNTLLHLTRLENRARFIWADSLRANSFVDTFRLVQSPYRFPLQLSFHSRCFLLTSCLFFSAFFSSLFFPRWCFYFYFLPDIL